MEFWGTVSAAVSGGAILAVLGILLLRPRRRLRAAVGGHGVLEHVEFDIGRMEISGGVEAPSWFCFEGSAPSSPTPERWGNAQWWRWAHDQGGKDLRTTVLQITLQGSADGPIAVEAPELTNHHAVPRDVDVEAYGPEGLGGNGIHSRRFTFTLDGQSVTRSYLDAPAKRPAAFALANGETQRLLVVVEALDDLRHTWTLDIPIVHFGRRTMLKVRDEGGPFVTYGSNGIRPWMWVDGHWLQSPASP